MKLWLFDILACAICKHYPLKLFIFSYENKENVFEHYIHSYEQQELTYHKKEQIPEIIEGDPLRIKDNIVIKETPPFKYFDKILLSLKELNYIIDKTSYTASKKCLDLAQGAIRKRIENFKEELQPDKIDEVLPELNFVNKIKVGMEISSGILFCSKCNRWYPIIDTIPRMLPDEYRDKDEELQFFKKNEQFLDKNILQKDLKPF
jgi:uncharacterized protein YbaR (Trm112 family)